jgi:hypothetical protein
MNDTERFKAEPMCLSEILFDDAAYIARRHAVKIENVRHRNTNGQVVVVHKGASSINGCR